ncbi:unnamed protein product [Calypogeia fissa]
MSRDSRGNLRGKIVLVTGASSGIGRELALALAKAGCYVVAAARRLKNLESLRDEIESSASDSGVGKVAILSLDVSADEPAIDAAVETAWNAFGAIDVLINNAGIRGSTKGPTELDEAEWKSIMDTNLKGPWLMSKAVGRRMQAAKRKGSIVTITSTAGLERSLLPGASAYGSSKAGANHLTKYMALELGKDNIRVNAIASGMFNTEITEQLFAKTWMKKAAEKVVPVRRWGVINPDMTSLVFLLCSDYSSYITGNVFTVDGGQSLPSVPIWSSL